MTIKEEVDSLITKYNTTNPFELCSYLDILVLKVPLISTKGFYHNYKGNKFIYLNSNLSDTSQTNTCCHELGHAILHPEVNIIFMNSNTNFISEKFEIQAKTFAAELLLRDIAMDTCSGFTASQIAALYNVDEELVRLKFKNNSVL